MITNGVVLLTVADKEIIMITLTLVPAIVSKADQICTSSIEKQANSTQFALIKIITEYRSVNGSPCVGHH